MSEPLGSADDASRMRARQADALFDAALDLPADERDPFVRQSTTGHQTLYDDVSALLRAHDQLGGFLATPVAPDTLGARLQHALGDSYVLRSRIATGGMASVYLAADARHDRQVAIKVFTFDDGPVAQESVSSERFLHEIRVTAKLQHPNLVPLFDSGASDGMLYYVMPFVKGETLRQRLKRESILPLEDALRIVHAIAGALDHAHAEGVVHRDLKPENILLRDGQPQVADFGIALALADATGQRMTRSGMLLGTPQYMSPEQASGDQTIDARSDVYALAAILYEMLAGDPPHMGSTTQGVLWKVIAEHPTPLHVLRDTIPHAVSATVARALAKQPADRFESAGAFDAALTRVPVSAPVLLRRRTHWPVWVAGALVVAVAAVAAAMWRRSSNAPGVAASQFVVAPLPDAAIGRAPSITPDGASMVYAGSAQSGRKLFVRKVSDAQARPLPGTEGALNTFLSPDGAWIAFTTNGDDLRRVSINGGAVTKVTDMFRYSTASWAGTNRLVINSFGEEGLAWVLASGGPLHVLTKLDARRRESYHGLPFVLPDQRSVLFIVARNRAGPGVIVGELAVVTLDTTSDTPAAYTRLGVLARMAVGYVDGWLLYVAEDGTSVAAIRFDPNARRVSGAPISVLEHVDGKIDAVALAQNGTLLYTRQLLREANAPVLVDSLGATTPLLGNIDGSFMNPRLSPDGTRLLVQSSSAKGTDIWAYEIKTQTLSRVTTTGSAIGGTWTPDGRFAVYVSTDSGRDRLWRRALDGSAAAEQLLDARGSFAPNVSRDGAQLIFQRIMNGVWGVWSAALTGDRTPHPVVVEKYDAFMPTLSPDGRWLAYAANESGRYEIYARAFPGPGAAMQVSQDGGTEPMWAADGRRLYFRDGHRMLIAQMKPGPTLTLLGRRVLFIDSFDGDMPMPHRNYDMMPDGRRFIMMSAAPGQQPQTIVVLNWLTDFRARVKAAAR